jgi:hypothetical protein
VRSSFTEKALVPVPPSLDAVDRPCPSVGELGEYGEAGVALAVGTGDDEAGNVEMGELPAPFDDVGDAASLSQPNAKQASRPTTGTKKCDTAKHRDSVVDSEPTTGQQRSLIARV